MNWLVPAGIVIFFFGLLVSIALHELGHFSFAKLFGVRVPQFMVGFGPTMWSWHKGETEYGVKWLPFGGYIRMIGMLPPRKSDGKLRKMSTSPFRAMIESARGETLQEVGPGDEDRVFYGKPWWQKVIIMAGGPFMNFVLAAVFLGIVMIGIGVYTVQPVVGRVQACVLPATAAGRECTGTEPATPAAEAGVRPGDRIVGFNGAKVDSAERLRELIRGAGGETVSLLVRRDGRDVPLTVHLITNTGYADDDSGRTVRVGFLGVVFTTARTHQGPGAVVERLGVMTERTVGALVHMPQKMVGVWQAAFGGDERDPKGPIGIVGASRIGGQVAAMKAPPIDKIATFLGMLAMFNFAVGMFNLVPLLPLDGGHILGGLWEGLKRLLARVARRPDPGYADVAKALPVAYAMAVVIIVMGVLLAYADLVNPVELLG